MATLTMHYTPRLLLALLAALSAAPVTSTWAAGFPIAISGDGLWVFRTDARNQLHRSAAGGATTDATTALPVPAHALSASADGRTVAYTSGHAPGCIGIATFGDGRGNGRTSWLRLDGAVGGPACVVPAAQAAPMPMALSGDGKRIALGGAQVRVLELTGMRTALTIPTGGDTVLGLRFVDDGRKLLVAQRANDGELRFAIWDTGRRELFSFQRAAAPAGPASSYAWHFAEATGDLWLVPPAGAATALSLAAPRGRKGKATPASPAGAVPLAVNIKQCGRQRGAAVLAPADGGWLASAADPRGRWLATVSRDTDEAGRRYRSRLSVHDARSGRVLTERLVEGDLQSLEPSANGNMLYGVLGVPVADGARRTGLNAGLSQPDGGQLLAFDLAADLGAAAQQPDAPWGARRCPIEDETAQARDITQDLQPPEAQFTVTLPADAPDISGRACHGDEWWQPGTVSERIRQWGVTPDGRVWIDRVNQLERLDKDTGLAAGRITTPRTDKVCSIPLYDAQQFLVWQGDSVSLRGFTGAASAMLVNKEGWFADSVVRLGDKFGVRWVKAQTPDNLVITPVVPVAPARPAPPPTGAGAQSAPAGATPAAAPAAAAPPAAAPPSAAAQAAQAAQGAQAALAALAAQAAQAIQGTQPAPAAAAAAAAPVATPDAPIAAPVSAPTVPRGPTATTPIQRGGMGSAVAIVYSAEGKPLRQVQGRVANSRPVFAAEQNGGSVFAQEAAAAAAAPKGGYRWLPGYFDSVRATRAGLGTVMWSGLEAQPGDAPPRKAGAVQGLGGAIGAVMEADALSVYDAAQRRRLARIPVEKATEAAWSPVNRLLLVESPAPGNGGRTQLSAYELD